MIAIRSRRVVTSKGTLPGVILVHDGKIKTVLDSCDPRPDCPLVDVGRSVVMPGIVDTHAHINEPGRTEWEGFQTATCAAAAGGITTVIDMPLNSIPATTTLAALRTKEESARDHCRIDYGFWGGIIPGNAGELPAMIEAGIMGFKTFLCESGVDEFPMSREEDLRLAMPILARAGVPLLVHAEMESGNSEKNPRDPRTYGSYLQSRPQKWEVDAVRMMIRLARKTGCRVHIVHLSAADALEDLANAMAEGIPITAETCPHYLGFTADEIPDGATQFKCAPPIREKENRERLWKAVAEGTLEFIVSDHSPCTPALKKTETGDFEKAWGGIAGLQFSMPVIWTEMRGRGMELADLVRLMSARTAHFLGMGHRKGAIAAGFDADLVVWDPEGSFEVSPSGVHHRHTLTPWSGRKLFGVVEKTFVRGNLVFDSSMFPGHPVGEQLRRPLTKSEPRLDKEIPHD